MSEDVYAEDSKLVARIGRSIVLQEEWDLRIDVESRPALRKEAG